MLVTKKKKNVPIIFFFAKMPSKTLQKIIPKKKKPPKMVQLNETKPYRGDVKRGSSNSQKVQMKPSHFPCWNSTDCELFYWTDRGKNFIFSWRLTLKYLHFEICLKKSPQASRHLGSLRFWNGALFLDSRSICRGCYFSETTHFFDCLGEGLS